MEPELSIEKEEDDFIILGPPLHPESAVTVLTYQDATQSVNDTTGVTAATELDMKNSVNGTSESECTVASNKDATQSVNDTKEVPVTTEPGMNSSVNDTSESECTVASNKDATQSVNDTTEVPATTEPGMNSSVNDTSESESTVASNKDATQSVNYTTEVPATTEPGMNKSVNDTSENVLLTPAEQGMSQVTNNTSWNVVISAVAEQVVGQCITDPAEHKNDYGTQNQTSSDDGSAIGPRVQALEACIERSYLPAEQSSKGGLSGGSGELYEPKIDNLSRHSDGDSASLTVGRDNSTVQSGYTGRSLKEPDVIPGTYQAMIKPNICGPRRPDGNLDDTNNLVVGALDTMQDVGHIQTPNHGNSTGDLKANIPNVAATILGINSGDQSALDSGTTGTKLNETSDQKTSAEDQNAGTGGDQKACVENRQAGTKAANQLGVKAQDTFHVPVEMDEKLTSCNVHLITYHNRIHVQLVQIYGHRVNNERCYYDVTYRVPTETRWKIVRLAGLPLNGMTGVLLPGTRYELYISCKGPSGLREAISLYRTTCCVGPPCKLAVNKLDENGTAIALVSWDPPKAIAPGVSLSGYSLRTVIINPLFDDDGESSEEMFPATTTNVRVPIDPSKSYKFQVGARCKREFSHKIETELLLLKHVILRQSRILQNKGKPIFQIELQHDQLFSSSRFPVLTLGHSNSYRRKEKVILVIGATGAGKTTLINSLINYVLGVQYSDPYRFKLVIEAAGDQAESQTKDISTYTLHLREGFKIPYTLTIIDTPGFGDTGGIARDMQIAAQLNDFFRSKNSFVDHIDAVGFVASASLPRLTVSQQYIFDSILSLFGKDIGENIYLLLTFADGKPPQVMSAIKKAKFPYQGYFKFNNSAIFDDIGASSPGGVSDSEDSNEEEEDENFNQMFWDLGMKSFEKFLTKIENVPAKSLQLTREVLAERERIELYIEELHKQVKLGLMKQEQLIQEQGILHIHEAQINSNRNFTYQVMEAEVVKLPIPDAKTNTTCLMCNYTCHPNCIYDSDADKYKCSAMNKRSNPVRCNICTNKCVWDVHRNTKYHYVTRDVLKTKTSADLKGRYEDAMGKRLSVQQVISAIKDEFDGIQGEIIYAIVEIRASLAKLQDIALKDNPLSTVEYIDTLIHSEKSEAQPGWQIRIDHLQRLRERAQQIHDIAQGEFDPFKDYRDRIEKERMGGVDFRDKKSWTKVMKKYKKRFEEKVKQSICQVQ